MSLDATLWAWRQKLKAPVKLVLLSLADRADENDDCHPSINRLVSDTGLDRKTVIKHLEKLTQLALIRIEKRGGKSSIYHLENVSHRHETGTNFGTGTGTKNGTGTGTKNGTPKNGTGTKNGTGGSTKNGTTPVPNLGHEPIKNLPLNLPEYINAPLFTEFWFVTRPARRAPNTVYALTLVMAELERIRAMGQDPNDALKKSVRSGWPDVYPEKSHDKKPSSEPSRDFSQTRERSGFLGDSELSEESA